MPREIPLATLQRADELIRAGGFTWDELGETMGYAGKGLKRAVYRMRRGHPQRPTDSLAEFVARIEAGASVEDVMARYGCSSNAAKTRLYRAGYTLGDVRAIRIQLGLEQPPTTAKQRKAAAFARLCEDRARAKAEAEAARLARRPALMLPPRVRQIIDPIARSAGVSLPDLTGGRRLPHFVRARHRAILALYAAFPEESLNWLGRPFGIHHTTVREVLVNAGIYRPRGVRTAPWAAQLAA